MKNQFTLLEIIVMLIIIVAVISLLIFHFAKETFLTL